MAELILVLLVAGAGVLVGWQACALRVERDEYQRGEQRDAEWDAAHGVRRG